MKVNALERAVVEAFTDRFPSFATVHQRAHVSVSVSALDYPVCYVEFHYESVF